MFRYCRQIKDDRVPNRHQLTLIHRRSASHPIAIRTLPVEVVSTMCKISLKTIISTVYKELTISIDANQCLKCLPRIWCYWRALEHSQKNLPLFWRQWPMQLNINSSFTIKLSCCKIKTTLLCLQCTYHIVLTFLTNKNECATCY